MTDKITINANMTDEELHQLFEEKIIGKPINLLNELIGDKFQVTYPEENTARLSFNIQVWRGNVPYVIRVMVRVHCENGIMKKMVNVQRIILGP